MITSNEMETHRYRIDGICKKINFINPARIDIEYINNVLYFKINRCNSEYKLMVKNNDIFLNIIKRIYENKSVNDEIIMSMISSDNITMKDINVIVKSWDGGILFYSDEYSKYKSFGVECNIFKMLFVPTICKLIGNT